MSVSGFRQFPGLDFLMDPGEDISCSPIVGNAIPMAVAVQCTTAQRPCLQQWMCADTWKRGRNLLEHT